MPVLNMYICHCNQIICLFIKQPVFNLPFRTCLHMRLRPSVVESLYDGREDQLSPGRLFLE